MRIKEIKLYKFDELSDEVKEKVIERLWDINVDCDWWDAVFDDAEQIGFEINAFDLDRGRYCKGNFIWSAEDVGMDVSGMNRIKLVKLFARVSGPGGEVIGGGTPEEVGANLACKLREANVI